MDQSFIKPGLGVVNWEDGSLRSPRLRESTKSIGQLSGIFLDDQSFSRTDPEQVVYRVQWLTPEDTERAGALLWGNTTIEPGLVGDEYFMTHGHFHAIPDRCEFYSTVRGSGLLLFMDRARNCWAEPMSPGSVHYIGPNLAHRAVNTGKEPLRFVACWPADAGHDYATIAQDGFALRVVQRAGLPVLVQVSKGSAQSEWPCVLS